MVEMGLPSEEGQSSEHQAEAPVSYAEVTREGDSDDSSSSDDDGKKNGEKKSSKKEHSHDKSTSSSSSSSSSSNSSSRSPHHHGKYRVKHHSKHHDKHQDKHHDNHHDKHHDHHQDEDEVMSQSGVHDDAHASIVEENAAPEEFTEVLTINGAVDEESDRESSASAGEAPAMEQVQVLEQSKGIHDESDEGRDGAVEEASSFEGRGPKEYYLFRSETTTSEPSSEVEIRIKEPEDVVIGVEHTPKIEEAGDAEFAMSAWEVVGASESGVAAALMEERGDEHEEGKRKEEVFLEKRETTDVDSDDHAKLSESAVTEEVADSEVIDDSANSIEEWVVEKREDSDKRYVDYVVAEQVAESEILDHSEKEVIEEEAVIVKGEISDISTKEDEKCCESTVTEEDIESEVVNDSVSSIEESVVEKRENSDIASQADEKHAESLTSEQVAVVEVTDDSARESIVEKRESSDVAAAAAAENHGMSTEKSVLAETEQVSQNANEKHFSANLIEIEGKSGHHRECFEGEDEEQTRFPDLSVQVRPPLELKNHLQKSTVTPSPPKRESSVYKIVMALESGLQVGEKCIHGEIDHGVCHQSHLDRKLSSPGSFSPTLRGSSRDSSPSPRTSFREEPPPEIRISSDGARETDHESSFVQHESSFVHHDSSSVTQVVSSTTKTETYTDTVLFRRDDGFLPRTPGRSPLSQESMRAVFSQAEGSSSSETPTLKIVHEFPAEHESASVVTTVREGESEVERIIRLQETHDLICPVCRSCITKRVILRKRKRTTIVSSVEKWERDTVETGEESSGEEVVDTNVGQQTVVDEYENYGCLNCFTFLFRRERSTLRTEVPRASDESPAAPVVIPVPPTPTREDYDNHCLPIFFTWRRKTTTSTDSEIKAPLLGEKESEEDSTDVRTESEDVHTEDVLQQSTSEIKEVSTSERKEISAAAETGEASSSEIQRPDAGTLTIPATPGVEGGVQIPVVVVESREDRLCFPFLWSRSTEYSQVHPEPSQSLLVKEDGKQEVEQQATETKDDVKTDEFSRIEDDLWMHGDVLHVPVSVSPEEEPQAPAAASDTPSVTTTTRVTEEERRADCLCFPSWSSSETTTEQTETSDIANYQQGVSVTEASGKLETSTSQEVIASTDLKKVVTTATDGSEITLSSTSVEGAVLPVPTGIQDSDTLKAGLNCIEILVPPYPWGSAGRGRSKEVAEVTEDRTGIPSMDSFQFSTVGYSDGDNSILVPVSGSSKRPEPQPNQSIIVAQSTERREDSTCFPLSLPALSWRRQDLVSGEIVDDSSKSSTSSEKKSWVERKSWTTTETKSWESSETKYWESSGTKSSESAESRPPKGNLVEREFDFGDIEVARSVGKEGYGNSVTELVEEEEEEEEAEPFVRKSPASTKKLEPESLPAEPSPVEEKERETFVSEETDIISSGLPEIRGSDIIVLEDGTGPTSSLPAGEDEPQENGGWNCCLPTYSQLAYQPIEESVTRYEAVPTSDALPGAPITPVKEPAVSGVEKTETVTHDESREKGSWSCCLPSYTQFAYHPIFDRESETVIASSDALPGSATSVESESTTHHTEVTRETTIDASIKTEVTTTTYSENEKHEESIESVRVDTTVSIVHGQVQHDKGEVEGTLHIDDHPTLTIHPVDADTKPAPRPRLVEEDEDEADAEVNKRVADLSSQKVETEVEEEESRSPEILKPVTDTDTVVVDVVEPEVERDGSCCGPSPNWYGTQLLWGRWNLATEEAHLREPLLGDSAQPTLVSDKDSTDSQDSARVTIHQKHEVTQKGPDEHGPVATEEEEDRCRCFPWNHGAEVADVVATTVTIVDDTVIQVEGTDVKSTLDTAAHEAERIGMVMEEPALETAYLKSIVYGGLDVSLTSLGVVAAAAGGDAKTRNILALGLSNLIFGFLTFFYKLQDMHKERPARFHESVGPRFYVNGPLAMLSFLLFGALPVLAFAFSFRESNDHDYKMAATVLASTIAVILLGCGKVAAKMTELSYQRTLTTLIATGIVASVAAFYTGEYISKLLKKFGILDE